MSDTPDATPPVPTPNQPAASAPAPAPAASAPAAPEAPALGAPLASEVAAPVVLPPENKGRGTALALLAIPAGIIVWNIVWAIGFISGWISLGIALFALFLYRKGSGGRLSVDGAIRLSVLTVVTLAVAFFIGLGIDRLTFGGPVVYDGLGLNVVFMVVFAILGIAVIVRTAMTTSKQQKAAEAAASTS